MGYFDKIENIEEYLKMAEGYDGRELIEVLKKYLTEGASVLELGMGPGKDLDILNESFEVTGSDNSKIFLDLYRKHNKNADLILLDAVNLDTDRKFDCIYSNKVLHHLTRVQLLQSFINQHKVLNESGILFHSFWHGTSEEEMKGLKFVYYTEETIKEHIEDNFELLELKRYKEMEDDDSFYIILRKNKGIN